MSPSVAVQKRFLTGLRLHILDLQNIANLVEEQKNEIQRLLNETDSLLGDFDLLMTTKEGTNRLETRSSTVFASYREIRRQLEEKKRENELLYNGTFTTAHPINKQNREDLLKVIEKVNKVGSIS